MLEILRKDTYQAMTMTMLYNKYKLIVPYLRSKILLASKTLVYNCQKHFHYKVVTVSFTIQYFQAHSPPLLIPLIVCFPSL